MKNTLRKFALEKRKTLDYINLSRKIINNLLSLPEYKKSKNIISYYPLKYEADTKICMQDKGRNIYLPRVKGDLLEICICKNLCKGSFGIMEPQTEAINDFSDIDIILIPACAADKKGYRLGYGKGYYDRFLPLLPESCKKVILIYSELVFDDVYPTNYDIKSDIIVTDKEVLRI